MVGSNLEEGSILLSVIVLFSSMFPRNPEDTFICVFPNQAGILPAVNLVDQPLPQFAVAAGAQHPTILIQTHPEKKYLIKVTGFNSMEISPYFYCNALFSHYCACSAAIKLFYLIMIRYRTSFFKRSGRMESGEQKVPPYFSKRKESF